MLSGEISGVSYLPSDQTKLLAQLYSSTDDTKFDVNKAMKNRLAVFALFVPYMCDLVSP